MRKQKGIERNVLQCVVDGGTFTIASLRLGSVEQVSLNLLFDAKQEVSFLVSGTTSIHLMGFYEDFELDFDDLPEGMNSISGGSEAEIAVVESPKVLKNRKRKEETADETPAVLVDTPHPSKKLKQEVKINTLGTPQRKVLEVNPNKARNILQTPSTPKAAELKVVPTTPKTPSNSLQKKKLTNGLEIEDLIFGDGEIIKPGKKVSVKYKGSLLNGKVFDSSLNKPFTFRLGTGSVIKGWDLGLKGMRVGGKRKLVIPPSLGYESKAAGEIPPNSTLVFEVEVVDA